MSEMRKVKKGAKTASRAATAARDRPPRDQAPAKKTPQRRPAEERRSLHARWSSAERCELNRVAARLGLSPSATLRFLVHAEELRGSSEPSLEMLAAFPGLWRERD